MITNGATTETVNSWSDLHTAPDMPIMAISRNDTLSPHNA